MTTLTELMTPLLQNKWLLIAFGGALGSLLRCWLSEKTLRWGGLPLFPIGTLSVNAVGCLLIGLISGYLYAKHLFSLSWSYLLITGFLGGLTTFSAFSLETFMLLRNTHYAIAALNVLLELGIGIGSTALGFFLMVRFFYQVL